MADTPKTTTTPLDPLTLTEWRNTIASWIGESYANLDSDAQTELNRYIDEAHDYISKRFGHEPWTRRVRTIAVSGDAVGTDNDGNNIYKMWADFRHLIVINEDDGTTTYRAYSADDTDYADRFDGSATHEWSKDTRRAHWAFYSMSDDQPPQQLWIRVGGPSSVTAIVRYRPYLSLLGTGSDSYTVIPAAHVPEIRAHIRTEWAAFTNDTEKYQLQRTVREDHITASAINDTVTTEDPMRQGCDSEFENLLG